MSQILDKYIEQSKVCSDLIFRNWNEFLDVLFTCGGSVNAILWFEYVLIEDRKNSLGGGGYRDTANPEYMWTETMICDKNLCCKSLLEIKEHIKLTLNNSSFCPKRLEFMDFLGKNNLKSAFT
ncbi:MAG: hypothetical protein IKY52_07190 [Clostridia bacterium]|nr:hypothetical protein [Clostridia bacterium]